ncbi:hypothetical protein FRB94_012728 [Tulasnella sp. JGI-2019a]|nr:hypothetical protein FRB94_012728 [Tulasnella sp. JGI-2019a]KAG9018440.1 hypothetical protein FRB93_000143 [Tulasnella sp. JGI-2019a]KAG9031832.1 hypothetical protein FRB95_002277 [Tulasnella sp. JGI-2019a]
MARSQMSILRSKSKGGNLDDEEVVYVSQLGGRETGQEVRPFSREDDEHLMLYLAHRAPDTESRSWNEKIGKFNAYQNHHGRNGNKFYKHLVTSGRGWPKTHSWQGWRNRYAKNVPMFEYRIREYLEENPWVRKDYVDRRLVDFKDEPGYEEVLPQERDSQQPGSEQHPSQEPRNASAGPSQVRQHSRASASRSRAEDENDDRYSAMRSGSVQPPQKSNPKSSRSLSLEQEDNRSQKNPLTPMRQGSVARTAPRNPLPAFDEDSMEEESTDEEVIAKREKAANARRRASKAPVRMEFGITPEEDLQDNSAQRRNSAILGQDLMALVEQRRLTAINSAAQPRNLSPPPPARPQRNERSEVPIITEHNTVFSILTEEVESTAVDRSGSGFGMGAVRPSRNPTIINFFDDSDSEQQRGPSRSSRSRLGEQLLHNPVPLDASGSAALEAENSGISDGVIDQFPGGRRVDEEVLRNASTRAGKKRRRDSVFADDGEDGGQHAEHAGPVSIGARSEIDRASLHMGKTSGQGSGSGRTDSPTVDTKHRMIEMSVGSSSQSKRVKKTIKKRLSDNPSTLFAGANKLSQDDVRRRLSLASPQAANNVAPIAARSRASRTSLIPELDLKANSPHRVMSKVRRDSTGARVDPMTARRDNNEYWSSPLRGDNVPRRGSVPEQGPSKHATAKQSSEVQANSSSEPPRKRLRTTRGVRELSEEPLRPFRRRKATEATNDAKLDNDGNNNIDNASPVVPPDIRRRLRSRTPAAASAAVRIRPPGREERQPSTDDSVGAGHDGIASNLPQRRTRATSVARK